MDFEPKGAGETVMGQVLSGAQKGILMAKPHIWAYQGVSEIHIAERWGFDLWFEAVRDQRGMTLSQTLSQAYSHSPRMRRRSEGGAVQLMVPGANPNVTRMFYGRIDDPALLKPIHFVDSRVIAHAWLVARTLVEKGKIPGQKAIVEGDSGYWEAAAQQFEWIVETTQPHWDPYTLPRTLRESRNRPGVKAFFMFVSQRSSIFNIVRQGHIKFNQSNKTHKDRLEYGRTLLYTVGVSAAMIAAIEELIKRVVFDKTTSAISGSVQKELTKRELVVKWIARMVGVIPGPVGSVSEAGVQYALNGMSAMRASQRTLGLAPARSILAIPETFFRTLDAAWASITQDEDSLQKWVDTGQAALVAWGAFGGPGPGFERAGRGLVQTPVERRQNLYHNLWLNYKKGNRRQYIRALIADGATRTGIISSANGRGITLSQSFLDDLPSTKTTANKGPRSPF